MDRGEKNEKKQLNSQGSCHDILMRHLMSFAITKKMLYQDEKRLSEGKYQMSNDF